MLRFFLSILFVVFSFLAVEADANDPRRPPQLPPPSEEIHDFPVQVIKASYIKRKNAIRVHILSSGCRDGYSLHIQSCVKTYPMQCDAEVRRHTVYPSCRRFGYTWVNFALHETDFYSREYSRAILTIHGYSTKVKVQLPEID